MVGLGEGVNKGMVCVGCLKVRWRVERGWSWRLYMAAETQVLPCRSDFSHEVFGDDPRQSSI